MAVVPHVAGSCLVKIDANQGPGLESLGYTVNGAEIEVRQFKSPVHGDQNGGEEGPPIDVQHFGAIHIVRLEFSTWDTATMNKVLAAVANGTAGVMPTPGSLMAGGSLYYRLLLLTANEPINYLRAFPVDEIGINKGSKYSKQRVTFECHANAAGGGGVIYNSTTS